MRRIVVYIICCIIALSCKNTESNSKTAKSSSAQSETSDVTIEGVPKSILNKMFEEGTLIDILFHELPFSVNQSEIASIRSNLAYISPTPLEAFPSNCKSIGRQIYQANGEVLLEADVYFSKGCQFYVFFVNGTPRYANYMSETGVNFFNNLLAQVPKSNSAQ